MICPQSSSINIFFPMSLFSNERSCHLLCLAIELSFEEKRVRFPSFSSENSIFVPTKSAYQQTFYLKRTALLKRTR